ncbi:MULTISPECIES: ATP-binding protein [Cyanophyceae]|uniref:sensor histidine kinase n=2 Tax=Cyanobacteriota TaxID=1117 RepID=UPI00016DC4BF|nr:MULTISPECIES: ATP-binding protein [Cyanophyceae]ACA98305.1 two-component hybrid sensor and regulator [Picosynechococcus sp. PCC 7002]ANV89434.1 hybrid sensor histidine kinase/response regulator [Picosynechococcus sp. PCC 8807]SMH45604.1 His Kinase A (phospho-acceptor) domain-containing protein [Picosynechococcus sp. OG1]SMQ80222.1 His Kinase A (phospho-acceptor) domain-containing protein [Synechococcus sp. 7002]
MHLDDLHILLIEDNLAEAELLGDLLADIEMVQCDIVHFAHLEKAIACLEDQTFDVILLDLSLPDSQGLSSLPMLMGIAPDVPIVVLTNTNDAELALEAVHQGAQDYLIKKNIAFDQETLLRSILYAIERKRNQQALKLANERLRQEMKAREAMQIKLEQSNQELEQFAYIASHDLKQPLASIYSWSQLLQVRYGNCLDEKGSSYLNAIQDSVRQMTQLIEDLLTYSRVDRVENTAVDVDCNLIVHQVCNRLSSAIAQQSAKLTIDSLPTIQGNPLQISQIFQNLIENALKYCREEVPPQIRISAVQNDNHWVFSCHDNGIGIEADYFEQIFYAFKRLHSQSQYSGTGIGLAVCKKIVRRYGGEIWLTSTFGEGSTFYFSFPMQSSPKDNA